MVYTLIFYLPEDVQFCGSYFDSYTSGELEVHTTIHIEEAARLWAQKEYDNERIAKLRGMEWEVNVLLEGIVMFGDIRGSNYYPDDFLYLEDALKILQSHKVREVTRLRREEIERIALQEREAETQKQIAAIAKANEERRKEREEYERLRKKFGGG